MLLTGLEGLARHLYGGALFRALMALDPGERGGRRPAVALRLVTDLGPLDILCRLHDGRGFDELAPHTITLDVDDLKLRVIDLRTLVAVRS